MQEIEDGSLLVKVPTVMLMVAKVMDFIVVTHADSMVEEHGLRRWMPLWK